MKEKEKPAANRAVGKAASKPSVNTAEIPAQNATIVNKTFDNMVSAELHVNHCGYEICKKAKPVVSSAALPYFRLHYIYKGSASLLCGNKKIELTEGSLFCLIPNTNISYTISQEHCGTKFFWIAFDGTMAEKYVTSCGITPDKPYLTPDSDKEILRQFINIFTYNEIISLATDLFLTSCLLKILAEMMAYSPSLAETKDRKSLSQTLSALALEYINNHFASPDITINSVAEELHIHPNHLSRIFKKEMHTNFVSLLSAKRISYAYHLIKNGFTNVQELSDLCGFNDPFYFSRVYHRYNGCSPSSDIQNFKQAQKKSYATQTSRIKKNLKNNVSKALNAKDVTPSPVDNN